MVEKSKYAQVSSKFPVLFESCALVYRFYYAFEHSLILLVINWKCVRNQLLLWINLLLNTFLLWMSKWSIFLQYLYITLPLKINFSFSSQRGWIVYYLSDFCTQNCFHCDLFILLDIFKLKFFPSCQGNSEHWFFVAVMNFSIAYKTTMECAGPSIIQWEVIWNFL